MSTFPWSSATTAFLACNISFLLATAAWFRLDHASNPERFKGVPTRELVEEVQWQYSLRSNLLVWGCTLSTWLLYIGEVSFLLQSFAVLSVVNVLTDYVYQYNVKLFPVVRKGHRIAAAIISSVAIVYWHASLSARI